MPKKAKRATIKYGSETHKALVKANDKERRRRTGKGRTRPLENALGKAGASKIKRRGQ